MEPDARKEAKSLSFLWTGESYQQGGEVLCRETGKQPPRAEEKVGEGRTLKGEIATVQAGLERGCEWCLQGTIEKNHRSTWESCSLLTFPAGNTVKFRGRQRPSQISSPSSTSFQVLQTAPPGGDFLELQALKFLRKLGEVCSCSHLPRLTRSHPLVMRSIHPGYYLLLPRHVLPHISPTL